MFVDASSNGKAAKGVMVDIGATHNFVSEVEVARLGLKLVSDDTGKIKVVNSNVMTTSREEALVCSTIQEGIEVEGVEFYCGGCNV